MHKTTTLKSYFFVLGIFVLLLLSGQINAQVVIGTPNLGYTRACASDAFNSYNVTFVFSPESELSSTNQFSIEMSDATGNFSNSTVVFTSEPGAVTTSPATLNFSIPETTAGEAYRIRIKSSGPVASSSNSVAFAAYYKLQDSPFTINNLVSSGAFCSGGSYLLTIDNPGNGSNDSPLNYPSLTYKWYRETSPTTSVYVGDGSSLSVSQAGTYFVKTNYGTCTSSSFSNRVKISEATSGEADAAIVSSLGNPYCPAEGMTTLSTLGGVSYQWFKDGIAIADATNQMYQTNESGTFSVKVDLGSCTASGSIDLESTDFESAIDVDDTNIMEQGDKLWAIVTTTANNPKFEWFFNDVLISGAQGDEYEATSFGEYKVKVTQTSGCMVYVEHRFSISEALEPFPEVEHIPNLISPNGDGINDTWIIPTKYVSGTNTEVIIMTNQGKVVLQTKDYLNNWPQTSLNLNSINQVYYYVIITEDQQTKKGSITVVK
ncbi:T9SS type B sorting domain-containing protein [Gelidibacter maritimus]|uniref:Gliding motility-associated C-terminal domain-containing protein n=1 Tax=Gelidibacter maritimus TaxID=2761487 RepID=A0A7W2M4J4_9FLAO|nr:gliding motility-associated C-terminal domain-containing protein [Gelidibacter maritimus]MBA6152492.1 gliding motility-associated C-terminal domain-containing protein [Gelidibacter maritimus]